MKNQKQLEANGKLETTRSKRKIKNNQKQLEANETIRSNRSK